MKINYNYSPNYDTQKRSVKIIVIHYTGMQSERESIKKLCDPKSKVSCHYLLGARGRIVKMVHEKHIAWHAGKSCWAKYKNLNSNSIGIELVNKGLSLGYHNFNKMQILALVSLCKRIIKRHRIRKKNILGHSDIAPLRKIDPGEKFPWEYLAKNKIGIWHDYKLGFLKKFRKKNLLDKKEKIEFIRNLRKIGYCIYLGNNQILSKTVRAFQRHFRKELINGSIDKECFLIAENLTKKL